MTLAGKLWTHERFFQGVRNGRSGSADSDSTITSKGGLDNGDPKVALSPGRRFRTYQIRPAQGSVPTPSG
jgi:hypothetical protein